MRNDNLKGWLFVFIQILLMSLIVILSLRDAEVFFRFVSFWDYFWFAVILLGMIMVILVFISFRQIMTPNPVPLKNYTLRTEGFYKYIRHPMYSAALLTLAGVVFYCKSISGFFVFVIACIFIAVKIKFEERKLIEKFPDYINYSRTTKKLIPYVY